MLAPQKKYGVESAGPLEAPKQRIRITLNSTDLKATERVCASFVNSAKSKNLTVKGPVRMPTKKLRITTRKTPCGEGSKTWDKFELRIYKRVVDIFAQTEMIKQIASFGSFDPNVDIEITVLAESA